MNEDILNKLPPDARKEFINVALKLSEKKTKSKVKDDFMVFVKHVWPEFIEGEHHKVIAEKLVAEASDILQKSNAMEQTIIQATESKM